MKELNGHLPGDYTRSRPLPPKFLRTEANARAREGHQYWYQEKIPSKGTHYCRSTVIRVLRGRGMVYIGK